MLRELLTSKRRLDGHGFALPTVMIVSVVMMIILVTAVQASASVRTALSNQYYNNLAGEAAEAGIMFANACIQNKDGYASWNQLQPNTSCDGNGFNGLSRYLIDNVDMRTTFNVSSTSSVDADPYDLTVSGSVQLLRKSDSSIPWKTITVKKKLQVQPCSKTITNLISNPSFEMSGAQFEPVSSGWSGYHANIYSTTNASGLGDGFRTILVQATGPDNDTFAQATPALEPGKTYTVSGMLHRPATSWNSATEWTGRRLSIAVYAYRPAPINAYFETYARANTTNPGSQRVTNTFTIPADATTTFFRLYNGNTSGDVYWDSIMLTEGTTDYQYKDGDTESWAWNGTYDNATSTGPVKAACTTASTCTPTNLITNPNIESAAPGTTNWTIGNTSIAQDSSWPGSGNDSLRITPTNSNGDSYASIGGDDGGLRLGMQAGKTYTVSATLNVPQVLDGSPYLPWRRAGIVIHTWNPISSWTLYSVNPTGKHQYRGGGEPTYQPAGWYSIDNRTHKLSTTFTIPTNAVSAFVRLYNGGTSGQPYVQWDNVALYEGTRAPYYDGNSAGWTWSGAANLSTSSGPVVPCNAPISY